MRNVSIVLLLSCLAVSGCQTSGAGPYPGERKNGADDNPYTERDPQTGNPVVIGNRHQGR